MTWWIVTVAPSLEHRAIAELGKVGRETWLPLVAKQIKPRHAPRAFWRTYPAYPGYVFVRVGDAYQDEIWHVIRSVDEVRGILVNAGRPLVLTDDQLSRAAARMVCSTVQMVEDAWRIGSEVMLTDGPFRTFPGFIAEILSRDRFKVDVTIFGRATPVEVTRTHLELVAS